MKNLETPEEFLQRVRSVLSLIRFLNFEFDAELQLSFSHAKREDECVHVQLRTQYTNFDNMNPGKIIRPIHLQLISIWRGHSDQDIIRLVHGAVIKIVTHEIGEQFYVDNVLPFNEHNNESSDKVLSRVFSLYTATHQYNS